LIAGKMGAANFVAPLFLPIVFVCFFGGILSNAACAEAASGQSQKKSESYTVQGKPASKEQYEAGKLLDEGLILLRANSNEQALQKFKQSLALYDGYAEVHQALGTTFEKLGNHDEAIKELKRAIEIKPDLDGAWLALAGFYQLRGDLQESVNIYTEFLSHFPANSNVAKVNVILGVLYAKLGRNDDAINELKHSIELNPNQSSAWVSLGGVYQGKGDLNNAIDIYQQFLNRFPKDPLSGKVTGLIKALKDEIKKQDTLRSQNIALDASRNEVQIKKEFLPQSNPEDNESVKSDNDDYLSVMAAAGGHKYWPSNRIPITVSLGDSSKSSGYRDSMSIILKKSFDDWSKASKGGFSFVFVDSPTNASIKVFWTDKASDLKNAAESGETKLFMDQSYIKNAEIWLLTQPVTKSSVLTDNVFRLVTLHEIGHALGLSGHTTNPDDIMFYSITFKDQWRELSGRDARSIYRLYHKL
ncbi:MAG: tetratricopeptide repeat protein, partial [Candidatus Obscuribacterales bacterium]|nr:tetratricopeptide repeat protein [Candidatus Obscuribacterales bacterium]